MKTYSLRDYTIFQVIYFSLNMLHKMLLTPKMMLLFFIILNTNNYQVYFDFDTG